MAWALSRKDVGIRGSLSYVTVEKTEASRAVALRWCVCVYHRWDGKQTCSSQCGGCSDCSPTSLSSVDSNFRICERDADIVDWLLPQSAAAAVVSAMQKFTDQDDDDEDDDGRSHGDGYLLSALVSVTNRRRPANIRVRLTSISYSSKTPYKASAGQYAVAKSPKCPANHNTCWRHRTRDTHHWWRRYVNKYNFVLEIFIHHQKWQQNRI